MKVFRRCVNALEQKSSNNVVSIDFGAVCICGSTKRRRVNFLHCSAAVLSLTTIIEFQFRLLGLIYPSKHGR